LKKYTGVHPGEAVKGLVTPLHVAVCALGVCACPAGAPIPTVMKTAAIIASAPFVFTQADAQGCVYCRLFVMNCP
jgi:hypothetical protein